MYLYYCHIIGMIIIRFILSFYSWNPFLHIVATEQHLVTRNFFLRTKKLFNNDTLIFSILMNLLTFFFFKLSK